MINLNIGIIYTDGKLHNHRTLLKIVCNPFLRMIGLDIASLFDNEKFVKYHFRKCGRKIKVESSWSYELMPNQKVVQG